MRLPVLLILVPSAAVRTPVRTPARPGLGLVLGLVLDARCLAREGVR